MADDAHQTAKRERHYRNVERRSQGSFNQCVKLKELSFAQDKYTVDGTSLDTEKHSLEKVARRQEKKDMALVHWRRRKTSHTEWASSQIKQESNQSSAAHQFSAESL